MLNQIADTAVWAQGGPTGLPRIGTISMGPGQQVNLVSANIRWQAVDFDGDALPNFVAADARV